MSPRPARPWFRFYVEAFNDRKLLRLTPAQRWIWVAVLGAARESPTAGTLLIAEGVPMTRTELARYADVKERDLDAALTLMEQFDMIDQSEPITVTNWSERQYESDDVTVRTRKTRSKERSKGVPANAPDTESETDTPPNPRRAGARTNGTNPRAVGVDAFLGAVVTVKPEWSCDLDDECVNGYIDVAGRKAKRCACNPDVRIA